MPKLDPKKQIAHAVNVMASIERQAREARTLLRTALSAIRSHGKGNSMAPKGLAPQGAEKE